MDMLHEIVLKYNSSHAVIIGGDFNSSMHRGTSLRRDRLLMIFVSEHRLNVGVDCPVGDTFFHASNDSFSQIDYFHRYHTVFLPSDVFRRILSQMRKNKKQKIETVNSYIKNLLTDTCESRDKVYISF